MMIGNRQIIRKQGAWMMIGNRQKITQEQNGRTMQLGGKLARGRTPTDHQEGQQATAFIVRDGGDGCLFKGINNVGANGPRVFQLFKKVNGIARFLSFGDGCDPKGVGLYSNGNHQLVVFHVENGAIAGFARDFLVDVVHAARLGLQVLSVRSQNGPHGFLDAPALKRSDRSTGKERCKDEMIAWGNAGERDVAANVDGLFVCCCCCCCRFDDNAMSREEKDRDEECMQVIRWVALHVQS